MAQTSTHVLYRLLTNPQYIEPLRQEVEAAVAEAGWTKDGMDKMRHLDSFLRETQRFDGGGVGVLPSFQSNPVTDAQSSSEHNSSCNTPVHFFQWHDRPRGYASGGSIRCYPHG